MSVAALRSICGQRSSGTCVQSRYTGQMKRNRVPVGIVIFLWDAAWKAIAIRRAVQNRQYRWVAPLILVNSVGILPMLYLVKWGRGALEPAEG